MDPKRKSRLTRILTAKKKELSDVLKREMSNFTSGSARNSCGSGSEGGDVSVSSHAEDVSIGSIKVRHALLRQVGNALSRLEEGKYGTCDECGEEIDVRRLRVMPFALLCKDCKEEMEILEQANRKTSSF